MLANQAELPFVFSESEKYLVNFIDSPGHDDFYQGFSTAIQ